MIIVGEKINGFIPSCGKAIQALDADYIADLARAQAQAGVDYIDCCPAQSDDTLKTMDWLVNIVQENTDVPISLDSPSAQVLAAAMKCVKKPGLINSVSLAQNKTDTIFPLIADTSWNVVAMLEDDAGIAKDAPARVEIFKRLLNEMEKHNIKPDQVFIDPMVETLATSQTSFQTFIDTCKQVKELCPEVHIISGLSNISYGLPVRKLINMSFMALAIEAGMDSAIIDPLNRDLMGMIYATNALTGKDEFCIEYLGAYRENKFGPLPQK